MKILCSNRTRALLLVLTLIFLSVLTSCNINVGDINANANLNGGETPPPETTTPSETTTPVGTEGLFYTHLPDGTLSVSAGTALHLEEIIIPESHDGKKVSTIDRYGFLDATNLQKITIPDSITSIGVQAFYHCNSLTSVYITDLAAWCAIRYDNFDGWDANPGCYASNLYLNGELVTELTIPDDITSIGDGAFYGFDSLTSVTIGNGVTSIGRSAFEYCSSLPSVTIPHSVTSIGSFAFNGCYSLTDIYFTGTKEKWNALSTSTSVALIPSSATIHFNYIPRQS